MQSAFRVMPFVTRNAGRSLVWRSRSYICPSWRDAVLRRQPLRTFHLEKQALQVGDGIAADGRPADADATLRTSGSLLVPPRRGSCVSPASGGTAKLSGGNPAGGAATSSRRRDPVRARVVRVEHGAIVRRYTSLARSALIPPAASPAARPWFRRLRGPARPVLAARWHARCSHRCARPWCRLGRSAQAVRPRERPPRGVGIAVKVSGTGRRRPAAPDVVARRARREQALGAMPRLRLSLQIAPHCFLTVQQPQHAAGHEGEQAHPDIKDVRFDLVAGVEAAEYEASFWQAEFQSA